MPAKVGSTPALPGLSPVCGKPIIARFDGGKLSSDGGVLALREIENLAIRTIEPTPAPEVRPARAQPIGECLTGKIHQLGAS